MVPSLKPQPAIRNPRRRRRDPDAVRTPDRPGVPAPPQQRGQLNNSQRTYFRPLDVEAVRPVRTEWERDDSVARRSFGHCGTRLPRDLLRARVLRPTELTGIAMPRQ